MSAFSIFFEYLEISLVLLIFGVTIFLISRRSKSQKQAHAELSDVFASGMTLPRSLHPAINLDLCSGCGACTKVCPEGGILKLVNGRAALVSPMSCVGHGACAAACPYDAISLVIGNEYQGVELPVLNPEYETNVPGLFIAGELGGMGLISNAVKQGTLASQAAINKIDSSFKVDFDLVIVGAGPAGLAAALAAHERGVSYALFEQQALGGAIANYPRQKVVMSTPIELPLVGKLKFKSNLVGKEELIEIFEEVRIDFKLNLLENTKFLGLEPQETYFKFITSRGTGTAKKILLCLGARGTPRQLGLVNENLPKVTYALDDPEQYNGQHIAIVGAGNSALEAAQALCKENRVTVIVRRDQIDTANATNRESTLKLAAEKRIELWYSSEVAEIFPDTLTVKRGKSRELVTLQNDFLFIFAGAEMPTRLLESFGIKFKVWRGESWHAS